MAKIAPRSRSSEVCLFSHRGPANFISNDVTVVDWPDGQCDFDDAWAT